MLPVPTIQIPHMIPSIPIRSGNRLRPAETDPNIGLLEATQCDPVAVCRRKPSRKTGEKPTPTASLIHLER